MTVWLKQDDGSWKVVFDTGSTAPSPCHLSGACFFDLLGHAASQFGRYHAREGTEAEHPGHQRAVDADVERHAKAAAGCSAHAGMRASAWRDVVDDGRLEVDFHAFRRSRVDPERMRKGRVRQLLDPCEAVFEKDDVLNALGREGADFSVLRDIRQKIQAALRVCETIRVYQYFLVRSLDLE